MSKERVVTNIINCFPVSRRKKEGKGWEKVKDEVELFDGRTGIRTGSEVIEVLVETDKGTVARYFDPLTGEQLNKTKNGDGLWSKNESLWRNVTSKGKHSAQRKTWKD